MKKFIKKSSTILIISLLAILMLVGCGSQNSETGVSENDATPTSAIAEEESEATVEPTEEPTSTPEATEEPESTTAPTEAPETPAPTEEPTEPPHTHNYSTSVTQPTCTTQGYTTYTCNCGHSYKDNYTNGSHNYSNGTCTACGASDPNYIPPHTHSWTEHTWTEDQVTKERIGVYICECGSEFTDDPSLVAHQASTGWDGTPAHTGWANSYRWIETITQIIHHYRECACGLREDID